MRVHVRACARARAYARACTYACLHTLPCERQRDRVSDKQHVRFFVCALYSSFVFCIEFFAMHYVPIFGIYIV